MGFFLAGNIFNLSVPESLMVRGSVPILANSHVSEETARIKCVWGRADCFCPVLNQGGYILQCCLGCRCCEEPRPPFPPQEELFSFPVFPPLDGDGSVCMSRGYRPVAGRVWGYLCIRGVMGGHSSRGLFIVCNGSAVLITILQIALQGHDPFKNQAGHALERLTENKRLFLFCFSNSYLLPLCILSITFSTYKQLHY